jgi:cysteinyl-tRNA synthetase
VPLDWTPDLLAQAKTTLDRLYGALGRVWEADETDAETGAVMKALGDDLNTPIALAALSKYASDANAAAEAANRTGMAEAKASLLAAGNLLGLLQSTPAEWAKGTDGDDNARIDALVDARIAARAAKDWTESDRIRDELKAEGIEIMDGADGASWRRI